ncbi:uncharacterized protein LOC132047515 [Lycium ferocissimum]|uniref:uncharacterized protein LOC132047515 n=1 Tax=Lycium ferocissimum TaxID=112874 RepID=UPI002815E9E2|nr:uncharacterized protein LOC132047515 [Lycium ferocissimum]
MLRACVLDFQGSWDDHLPLIECAYNNSYHASIKMAPYKALYGRKCRSPVGWFKVVEANLFGPDLVHQAIEKVKLIQERLRTAQSRQKSYADVRRRELEFQVAYELELPTELQAVHLVFHVSMLRKCIGDPSRIVPVDDIQVIENLTYEEEPVAILDRQVRRLRNKDVASVKVLWRSKYREEMTWEAEAEMRSNLRTLLRKENRVLRRKLQDTALSFRIAEGKRKPSEPCDAEGKRNSAQSLVFSSVQ